MLADESDDRGYDRTRHRTRQPGKVKKGSATLARVGVGEFVGEIALLTNEPRNANVKAIDDTTTFALSRPVLAAAFRSDPAMGIALLEAMALRQSSTQ